MIAVRPTGKGRELGKHPFLVGPARIGRAVHFIELEAGNALADEVLDQEIAIGVAHLGIGQVRHHAAPHLEIAEAFAQQRHQRGTRINVKLAPEIQIVTLLAHRNAEVRGKLLGIPKIRTRIGVRLPSRFQPDGGYRYAVLLEPVAHCRHGLGIQHGPEDVAGSDPRHGRHAAAACEEIIAGNRLAHGRAGKQVQIHAARGGHVHVNGGHIAPFGAVQGRDVGDNPVLLRRAIQRGEVGETLLFADGKRDVPSTIHQHAIAGRADVERHRGVAHPFAVVVARRGKERPPPAVLHEMFALQAQAVDDLAALERQFNAAAARMRTK